MYDDCGSEATVIGHKWELNELSFGHDTDSNKYEIDR